MAAAIAPIIASTAVPLIGGLLSKLFNLRKGGKVSKKKLAMLGISQKDQVPVHLHAQETILDRDKTKAFERVLKKRVTKPRKATKARKRK